MFDKELCTFLCNLEPLTLLLNIIVEHAKQPNLSTLKPHEFISVVDLAILINAGEKTSILVVYRVLSPKRNHLIQQLVPV